MEVYIKKLHSMMQMPAKNDGIRTKLKPNGLLHKGKKNTGKNRIKIFLELWKLIKGLQQSAECLRKPADSQ